MGAYGCIAVLRRRHGCSGFTSYWHQLQALRRRRPDRLPESSLAAGRLFSGLCYGPATRGRSEASRLRVRARARKRMAALRQVRDVFSSVAPQLFGEKMVTWPGVELHADRRRVAGVPGPGGAGPAPRRSATSNQQRAGAAPAQQRTRLIFTATGIRAERS